MPRIVISPEAARDLDDLAYHLASVSRDVSAGFLHAVDSTLMLLATRPGIGQAWEPRALALAGLRNWSVDGFRNHLIFYRPIDDGIEVIRVAHAARDLDRLFKGGN